MPRPPRLIDLHCRWVSQYATETSVFDPALYPETPARLGQSAGYLQGASAAVLACHRKAEEWAGQSDPWSSLGALVTRMEAEFPGRLLTGADDVARWHDEPDGLCWGAVGVEGFDALVRGPADLDRLPGLFERGVRFFQPVDTAANVLAGSSSAGDHRGLTDLGRAFLGVLGGLASSPTGPRPVVDLAGLNPVASADVLDWFEADAGRAGRLIPVFSHGGLAHQGSAGPSAITAENLRRLRALGGVVGFGVSPGCFPTSEALKVAVETAAGLPNLGQPGYQGIAIGTSFLGVDQTLPGLGNVDEVVAWFWSRFRPDDASALLAGNARALLERAAGRPENQDGPPGREP